MGQGKRSEVTWVRVKCQFEVKGQSKGSQAAVYCGDTHLA